MRDDRPGISRRRAGRGFTYRDREGATIRDHETLARIRSLAVPPAWTDVWICPDPRGHLQATGRDARGRKQYRYHPRWREVREEHKFDRLLAFGEALPSIRRQVDRDLRRHTLDRRKVLAAVVSLLERTGIRIGNDEYARENHSFGLTTLRDRHVSIHGAEIRFEFRGKRGKPHQVGLRNRRLARIVQACQAIPGQELFQYLDENDERQAVSSEDVNEYLRDAAGGEFTAKDFRTWAGTMLGAAALYELGGARTRGGARARILEAIDRVADRLNNTRAVCRRYYVHPDLLRAYEEGRLCPALDAAGRRNGARHGLLPLESTVCELLRGRASKAA